MKSPEITCAFTRFVLILAAVLFAPVTVASATEDDEVVTGPMSASPEQDMHFGWPNFDQVVFQGNGDAKTSEDRMRARTELQLAELERVCRLSEAQKRKLQLAARGDQQRFFSEVSVARKKYDDRMKGGKQNDRMVFQQLWMELQVDVQPLQRRVLGGLTSHPESLFMKVLPQTLTADQRQAYQVVVEERKRLRYEANVSSALVQLDEAVSLTEDQREALTNLLEKMPVPKGTQYLTYLILIRLGSLPPEMIRPLFTADQWTAFNQHVDQYRNLRQPWIDAGVIEAEDVPPNDVPKKDPANNDQEQR